MPARKEFLRRNALEASFEILLGLVLAVACLVPFGFAAAGLWKLIAGGLTWERLFVTVFGGLVFICFGPTSWRLMTGRPRSDGGLLSPAVIALAGIGIAAVGVFGVIAYGWPAFPRGALFVASGISTVMIAWDRIRRRRQSVDRLPNKPLQPTSGRTIETE
jgi:hypothetical protein